MADEPRASKTIHIRTWARHPGFAAIVGNVCPSDVWSNWSKGREGLGKFGDLSGHPHPFGAGEIVDAGNFRVSLAKFFERLSHLNRFLRFTDAVPFVKLLSQLAVFLGAVPGGLARLIRDRGIRPRGEERIHHLNPTVLSRLDQGRFVRPPAVDAKSPPVLALMTDRVTGDLLELRNLVQTAERFGRVYQAGTQQRSEYGGKFRQACELIRNGVII